MHTHTIAVQQCPRGSSHYTKAKKKEKRKEKKYIKKSLRKEEVKECVLMCRLSYKSTTMVRTSKWIQQRRRIQSKQTNVKLKS